MQHAAEDSVAAAAIADILALYCHAIDRRRWSLIECCFHADATYRFGPIDGTWRDFVRAAQHMIDPLPMTHHQLGQTVRTIDGAQARAETYFTAIHRVPADAAPDAAFPGRGHDYDAVIAGRYVDDFERRDQGWRIARRLGMIDARHDVALSGDAPPVLGADDPGHALALAPTGAVQPT
jgi:hypothetical protein